MKNSKKNFTSRYNRKMFIVFVAVLFISISLALIEIHQIINNNNTRIIEGIKSRTMAIDNFMLNISSNISSMQIKAENFFIGLESSGNSKILNSLSMNNNIYSLDNIPYRYMEYTGNIIGEGNPLDFSVKLRDEIKMSISLNPLFKSTKHNIKNSEWIYYLSVNNFKNIYPWMPSKLVSFKNFEKQTIFLEKCKIFFEKNKKIEIWLRGPYYDVFGKGLMFTALKPVYVDNKLIGVVAIDITLEKLGEYLDKYVNNFDDIKGSLLIVNEDNQVIASPDLSFEKIYKIEDIIPDKIQEDILNKEQEPLSILKAYSYLYIWNRIENAPQWRVIFISEKGTYFKLIISRIATVFFILLTALLIIIFYTKKITFKEFIYPAEELVRYIEKETNNEEKIIPDVPEYWLNWFVRISELFKSHRKLFGMEKELNVARDIQHRSLPRNFSFPPENKIELYADIFPAREVGGDLYNFFEIDEKYICIAIGDVVGKGVPAALMMTVVNKLIEISFLQKDRWHSPGEIINQLNEVLCYNNQNLDYVTLFFGILDVTTGELRYVNCGHAPQPLFTNGGNAPFFRKEVSGPPVGSTPDIIYKEFSAVLPPGEAILLCTDGVTEAMNKEEQLFGDKRLLESFARMQDKPCKEVIDGILREVRAHAGDEPQSDDITMLMIRWGAENKNADVAREQKQQGA